MGFVCVIDKKSYGSAHIVPEPLESKELAYILGIGDENLGDERNGEFVSYDVHSALEGNISRGKKIY